MNPQVLHPALLAALAAVLLGSSSAVVVAQDVPIPGARFEGKRARPATPFAGPGWEVSEGVIRVRRGAGPDGGENLALRIPSGGRIARELELPPLPAPKDAKTPPDPAAWTGVISLDCARAGDAPGWVTLRLRGPGTEPGEARALRREIRERSFEERIRLVLPLAATPPGRWTLEVLVEGAPLLVDELRWARLPRDPAAMHFAKSNGPHGPDRVESGALGIVGWSADGVGPLAVKALRPDSPAARAGIRPGDLLIEVEGRPLPRNSCRPGWAWFRDGHEAFLARAATLARKAWKDEKPAGRGPRLGLAVLRGEERVECELELDARAPLPAAFPFDEILTPRLYDDLIDRVRRDRRHEGRWADGGTDWIQTSFAGLALLGRRDPADAATIRETADWFLVRFAHPEDFGNLGYWAAAYAGIFMCEYLLASGDDRVRPWIERSLAWVREGFHTSKWGTLALGHGPDGLPYGNKALMAPASHLIVFEALAREAGIESGVWERLMPYMEHAWSDPRKKGGHGAMGYNGSYRDLEEFWSRSGLFALACELRRERGFMKRSIVKVMRARHPWMRNSHAYGNPGDVWGLVGLAAADRGAFAAVMRDWRELVDGAWQEGQGLRHSTAHMGSPYMGEEGLVNPAWAMLLSVRHRGLAITGAPRDRRRWLRPPERVAPLGAVIAERDAQGRILLRGTIPDALVRWAPDGADPRGAEGVPYTGPIAMPQGGHLRACTTDGRGGFGPLLERDLDLPESGWRILAATGDSDPERARTRAEALIDEDPRRLWTPDRGEGARDLPLSVVIDFGRSEPFAGLRFRGPHRPRRLALRHAASVAALAAAPWIEVVSVEGGERGRFALETLARARFLEVEIREMEAKAKLRPGELDLWRPTPVFDRRQDELRCSFAPALPGLRLVSESATEGGARSRDEAPATTTVEESRGRAYRVVDEKGRAVGPVRRFLPR